MNPFTALITDFVATFIATVAIILDMVMEAAANLNISPAVSLIAVVLLGAVGTYFMKYGIHVGRPGSWKTVVVGYPALFTGLCLVVMNVIIATNAHSGELMALALTLAYAGAIEITRRTVIEPLHPLTAEEEADLYDADIPRVVTSPSDARRTAYADVQRAAAANAA
jgi:hypothetical protein